MSDTLSFLKSPYNLREIYCTCSKSLNISVFEMRVCINYALLIRHPRNAGSLQIYLVGAQAFKPQTTFNLAIEISNPAETVPSPITFQFDVTVVDFCKDSSLSFDTSFADVNYSIEVSPSPTQSETFPSVTTSTDATRCPFTVNL